MFATPIRSSAFRNLSLFIRPRIPKNFQVKTYWLDGLLNKKGFLRTDIKHPHLDRLKAFSSLSDMAPPKAWFKLVNPESKWDRVPLEEIEYVVDLKKAIKKEVSPKLDAYSGDLIVKATKKTDDVSQALELDERKDLVSILKDLNVESPAEDIASIQRAFADNIWLFVSAPALPPMLVKQNIANAFPNGLPYVPPKPLLNSSGLIWEYQASPELLQVLREEIKAHYAHYRAGEIDKLYMPIYLFLSGAGTGKSRNASEFHRTAVECLGDEDAELKNKLRNAWVFHVSLENDSSLRVNEPDPFRAIGNRMLLQLLPGKELDQIVTNYETPDPMEVLRLVAKHKGMELKDATIIVVVDGMHRLMSSYEDGLKADSRFYQALTSIGDLSHNGAFLLPCCTATISRPFESSLKSSQRRRVYLPSVSLETPTIRLGSTNHPVFEMDNTFMKILEGDCGGHARALEVLWDVTRGLNLDNCDVGKEMSKLRIEITKKYQDAVPNQVEAKAIMRAVLTHQRLAEDEYIPHTKKFPDQVVAPGLIRYEKIDRYGYLHVPYIWFWMMADRTDGESLFPDWKFDDYHDLFAKVKAEEGKTLPSGCSWKNFEIFNAQIRAIKSHALEEGQWTKISELHFGARLNGDISFINHHLYGITPTNRIDTYTTKENSTKWIINTAEKPINFRQHKHIVSNADGAEAGDAFLSLDARQPANEIQQYKLYGRDSNIKQEDYEYERNKAASDQDFFILFTTQEKPCDINLPVNSGIVDRENWRHYFGPFAGRAFVYATEGPPNINKAGYATLQLVDGVGPVSANKILEKRPFSSLEDAMQKTNIKRRFLEQYRY